MKQFDYLVALLIIALPSCKETTTHGGNTLTFEPFALDTVVHLYNDTLYPSCELTLKLQLPTAATDSTLLQEVQEWVVGQTIGNKYIGEMPEIAVEKYAQDYISHYLEYEKEYSSAQLKKTLSKQVPFLNYYEQLANTIDFCNEDYLSTTVESYAYTGGAHGISGKYSQTYSFDLQRALMLTDLFNEQDFAAIGQLIVRQISNDQKLDNPNELQENGFFSIDEVLPSNNFCFNEMGITWTYNPYEIAAYSTGQVDATLTWAQLLPFMQKKRPVYDFAKEHKTPAYE